MLTREIGGPHVRCFQRDQLLLTQTSRNLGGQYGQSAKGPRCYMVCGSDSQTSYSFAWFLHLVLYCCRMPKDVFKGMKSVTKQQIAYSRLYFLVTDPTERSEDSRVDGPNDHEGND